MSNTEEKKTKLRESAKTWAAENPEKVKEKNERHNVRRRLAALDRREQEAREFLSTVVMEREKLLRELGCISD
jgi:FixJ family two-component response regulator